MHPQADSDGEEHAAAHPHAILTALGLSLGLAVGLGLGRFAYALLVPDMRQDLGWSYAQAGTMNTVNAAGYLLGALAAAALSARVPQRRLLAMGLVAVTVSLPASALVSAFPPLLAFRLVAGVGGAFAFVAGAAIAAELAANAQRSPALILGLYFAGAGTGIALSGMVVPFVLTGGGHPWRAGWLALGVLAVVCTAVALRAAPALSVHDRAPAPHGWPARGLLPTIVAYTLYGAGYIAYMTFVVALIRERATSTAEVASFWILLGLAAVASTFLWRGLLDRLSGGRGVAATLVTVFAGSVVLLISDSPIEAFLSAALFGGSFLAVVTAVTALVQRTLDRRHWPAAIAGLTVAFALGQTLGPVLTGWVSDRHGLRAGLLISAALIAVAALVALLQREFRATPAVADSALATVASQNP